MTENVHCYNNTGTEDSDIPLFPHGVYGPHLSLLLLVVSPESKHCV